MIKENESDVVKIDFELQCAARVTGKTGTQLLFIFIKC